MALAAIFLIVGCIAALFGLHALMGHITRPDPDEENW